MPGARARMKFTAERALGYDTGPMTTPLLEARGVTKIYRMGRTEVRALDGVSLGVRGGEFVAIQGTSGSGKSTLLNLLGGLDRPTGGEVLFEQDPLGPFTKKQLGRYRRRG